ncbi:MAG: hypothetical protein ABL913_09790 [Methyloglobulus sp.]
MRVLLLIILALTTLINVLLVAKGQFDASEFLLTTSSFIISILALIIFHNQIDSPGLIQLQSNVKEAQHLLFESKKRLSKLGLFFPLWGHEPPKDYSYMATSENPLVWLLSVSLYSIFFMTSPYKEFDINNEEKFLKLVLLTLLQIGMLSFAISGILVSLYKQLKGIKE